MDVTILKCKLKEEKPDGAYVFGIKRFHDQEFEIVNPKQGDVLNLKKMCDVEETKKQVSDEEIASEVEPEKAEDSELSEFAMDCWNLAVELREKITELEGLIETPKKDKSAPSKTRKKKAK